MNTPNNDKPHRFTPYETRMISDFLTQLQLELCIVSKEIDVELKNPKDAVDEKLQEVYSSGIYQRLTHFQRKYGERLWDLTPLATISSMNEPDRYQQLKPKVDEMVCRLDDLIPFIDHMICELEQFEVMVTRRSLDEIQDANNGWGSSSMEDSGVVGFFSIYQVGIGDWDADPCLINHLTEAPAIAVSHYDNEAYSFLRNPKSSTAVENGIESEIDALVINVNDADELDALLIALCHHFQDLNTDVSL